MMDRSTFNAQRSTSLARTRAADGKPAPLSDMSDLSDKSDKSAECAKRRGVIGTADRSEVKADNRKPETGNRKLLRVSARRAR